MATALLSLALGLAACGGQTAATPTPGATDPSGDTVSLTVVATAYPLAWLAQEIAPGTRVRMLAAQGQDPHDLELSPGDRAGIETADILLYMGALDFQPQVEQAARSARGQIVDAAEVAGPARLRAFGNHLVEDTHDDGHGHEDEGNGDGGDPGNDDEHGEIDPHLWFDATIMADLARTIGAAFATADPGGAAGYSGRADEVAAGFEELSEVIAAMLSDCRLDTAIVSHEAYAYLLEPHGLGQEGVSGAGGHGEVSPRRLAELAEKIRAEGIPAVLAEPLEGRADAEALAREADVELLEIDPLEGPPADDSSYLERLREQAATFALALECGSGEG